MQKHVIGLERLKFVVTILVITLLQARIVVNHMLHLDLFILLELVVLHRVAESLVRSELLFHHALEHTVMWELLLQLSQLLTDLPSICRLCQLIHSLLIELCLLLLGKDCLLLLLLLELLSSYFVINVLLNDCHAILRTINLIGRDEVDEARLAITLQGLDVVQF